MAAPVPDGRTKRTKAGVTTILLKSDQGAPHATLLAHHGLPEDLLEQLARDVDEFDHALTGKRHAQYTHVGASAALQKTCSEILAILRQFDAVHRVRFRGNVELLAAWNSARNIPWPRHRKQSTAADTESTPNDSPQQ